MIRLVVLTFRVTLTFLVCGLTSVSFAQTCVDSIIPTTDIRDYKLDDSGTITHRTLKIMWNRCALGQTWQGSKCTGEPVLESWVDARRLATASSLHSFKDWRLPSIHELSGITELSCQNPAINLKLFPNAPSVSFWTATEFVNDKNLAWQIFIGSGENHGAKKSIPAAILLVRSLIDGDE